jgi:hypothetical protein
MKRSFHPIIKQNSLPPINNPNFAYGCQPAKTRIMTKAIIRFISPLVLLSLACAMLQQVVNQPIGVATAAITTPTLLQTPNGSNLETAASLTLTPSETQTGGAAVTLTVTNSFVCPNAPPTRFKVGDKGQVTMNKGLPTRLRRDPEVVDNKFIKLLPDGTKFEIIAGPICATKQDTGQSFIFWQVRMPDDPITGWIAEGDAQGYYIEPIP